MKNLKKFLKVTLMMLMVAGCYAAMGSITASAATSSEVQIFSFDSTTGWWGDVMPNLATSGQKEGTGYFTTDSGTIMCGNLANTVDMTDAQALKMWVYISDASKLVETGPQLYLDITHVENSPISTTSWTVAGLQSGWNELTFHMSDAVGYITKLYAIKFIHVRIDSTAAVTFGLDDLRKIVPIQPTITRLDDFETLTGHWGTGTLALASTNAPQGDSYIKVVTPDEYNAYVICGTWSVMDLRKYTHDGIVKVKVYVDDDTKLVNQGAIELYDNASGVIVWNNISTQLETGWNELSLNISDASTNTANLANIITFRFYQYTNATGTFFGVDDLRILNPEATYNEIKMFPFDSTTGWWGDVNPTLATTGQKEGTGYFTTDTGTIMCGNLANTVDMTDAYALKMWVYISDASKLVQTGPQLYLRITHVENYPLDTTSWTAKGLKTGWNELTFYMSDAVISDTDLSAIKFIHVSIDSTAAVTFGLDDLRRVMLIQPTKAQLDTFETLTGHWGTGTLDLVSTNAPQGTSYIKVVTPDVNNAYVICGTWSAVDLRKYAADGIVKVKVYVDDDTKLVRGVNQGAIELYDNASGVVVWNNISTQLETGWNELSLNISDASTNTVNLANIITFRFYQYTNATGTFFGVDDLKIMNADYFEPLYVNRLCQIDATSSLKFTGTEVGKRTGIHLVDTGVLEVTSIDNTIKISKQFPNTNLSEYANGYLYMWLYVSDASNISNGQIEITSSQSPDYLETSWDLTNLDLVDGWNELALPISSADVNTDAIWSITNYFRVYANVTGQTTIKLEGVYVGTSGDIQTIGIQKSEGTRKPYMIDNMDSTKDWSGSTITLQTSNAPEGTGYLSSSIGGSGNITFTRSFITTSWAVNTFRLDLREYKDSRLNLSIYVSDASKVSGGRIELTSSGESGSHGIYWGEIGTDIVLTNGWNIISLKFDDGVYSGGVPDFSALNYLKIYFNCTDAVTVGLDNIYAGLNTQTKTISFDKGDQSATGTAPASINMLPGGRIDLPANTFARSGYKFAGWNDGVDTYLAGAYYTMPSANTVLTAQWTAVVDTLLSGAIEAWSLNDGGMTGYVASDLDNGTAATSNYGVWLNSVTFGKVLDFSIGESYLYADSDLSSTLSSKVFSISTWIMAPIRENSNRTIFVSGNFSIYLDTNGKLTVNSGAGTAVMSNTDLIDTTWHHILIAYNSGNNTLKGYIDGTNVYSDTLNSSSISLGTDLVIGAYSSYTNGFDGSMAQFRIYNSEKLPSQVTSTTINSADNTPADPLLDLKQGIVVDRRQYWDWRPNDGSNVCPQDITNIKDLGFDHVKLLLTPNWLIDTNGSLIEERMVYIASILDEAVSQGLKVLLCVHPEEGFKGKYMGGSSKAEVTTNLQPLLKWYGDFASYVAEHWSANSVAIQLMTEPNSNSSAVSWDWIADRMWGAARNAAPDHTIITSSDYNGNLERLKLMSPVTDNNLIYSFTTYEPYTIGFNNFMAVAGENFWKYINEVPYPAPTGLTYQQKVDLVNSIISNVPSNLQSGAYTVIMAYINGESDNGYVNNYTGIPYGYDWHLARAASLDAWSDDYGGNIHMMCVEFSCSDSQTSVDLFGAIPGSGESDATRISLITDLRQSFEAYNIGWSYWSYNEAFTMLKPGERKGLVAASLVPTVFDEKVDTDLVTALLGSN